MRFIIIGCGRMGATLAQKLSHEGHTIAVVDNDPEAFASLGTSFAGAKVEGVGFDRDVLAKAGIKHADGLAAVTRSDETNVVIARLAKEVFKVPRVIARIYDSAKAETYRRLGLMTIAPIVWGAQRLADMLASPGIDVPMTLGNGGAEIVEVDVPQLLVGRTSKDLIVPGELHLVAIQRGGKVLLPSNGITFREDDRLYLAVLSTSINRLKALQG